ncbi:MAG TPA: hypothetical protein VIM10_15870, partial [Actinopolymorphaceae bacterium]
MANNYGYFFTSWKQIVGSGTQAAPDIDLTVPGDVAATGADARPERMRGASGTCGRRPSRARA